MNNPVGGGVCRGGRLPFLSALGAVLGLLHGSFRDVDAEPAESARVTVRCTRPALVAGLALRVLTSDPVRKELLPMDKNTRFDAKGEAGIDLAPGTYTFEAAAARDDGAMIVVQSDAITVPGATSAVIVAGEPREIRLNHKGIKLHVSEVGVRSAAAVGETRWRRKTPAALPRLVLTPGKSTGLNVIGSSGAIHVAAWVKVTTNDRRSDIQIPTQDDWNDCRFVRRAGTPKTQSVTAKLVFPDSRMQIPVTGASHVLTNRRFLLMGYRVELHDGSVMEFEPLPYNIDPVQRWEIGGAELTPHAWAAYVSEADGAKWWPHFVWRFDLLDPGGHRLNVHAKNSGAAATVRRMDGNPIPKGRVNAEERKKIGDLAGAIGVKAEWVWNGRQSCELAPETWIPLCSKHFRIASVPAWEWQSRNYLSKLERYYSVERTATARPGPASIKVDWRHNTHNAKAIIGSAKGGQKRVWCSLPFRGYESGDDPFGEPRFLGHELLHTFGYHHGDEMTRLQRLVEFKFSSYRWYIVDHPDTALEIVQDVPEGGAAAPTPKKQPDKKTGV